MRNRKLLLARPALSASVPVGGGKLKLLTAGEQAFSPLESVSVRESLKRGRKCAMQGSNLHLQELFLVHARFL